MKASLHTAEHILYSILENKFDAQTKAMELSDDVGRAVYLCADNLGDYQEELETAVNQVISKNCPVINYLLSREAAGKIVDLSLVPESVEEIKIYEIVGFNKLACLGPHVSNTSEIGKFQILKIDKKGKDCFSIKFTVK